MQFVHSPSQSNGRAQVPKSSARLPSPEEKYTRKKDDDEKIDANISSVILVEDPNIKMSDVVGLKEAKNALAESVVFRLKFKHLFTKGCSVYNNILLYGPPGNGKTYLAKASASEAGSATFITISTADILSKFRSETEKLIRGLFCTARKESPSIVFIDEIDSIFSSDLAKKELIIQMNRKSKSMEGVLLLATTSVPRSLDSDTRKLFDKKIYVPLPDYEARKAMIELKLKGTRNNITHDQINQIANITEGFTGSDIGILAREASMIAVRKLQSAKYFREYEGKLYPCHSNDPGAKMINMMDRDFPVDKIATPAITFYDLEESVGRIRPSVSPKDIARFEEWTEKFNSNS